MATACLPRQALKILKIALALVGMQNVHLRSKSIGTPPNVRRDSMVDIKHFDIKEILQIYFHQVFAKCFFASKPFMYAKICELLRCTRL